MEISNTIKNVATWIKDAASISYHLNSFEKNSKRFYLTIEGNNYRNLRNALIHGEKALNEGRTVLALEEKLGVEVNLPLEECVESLESNYQRGKETYESLFPTRNLN